MPDIYIHDLSREQIAQLDKLMEVFPLPGEADEVPPIIMVLEAAKVWYGKRQQELRSLWNG